MILIPIKDFFETKTRIRAAFPADSSRLIENLVKVTYLQTIETINSLSYPFGVISPSMSIINQSRDLGAVFTYCDSGIDLNIALLEAVQKLPPDQPILVIMPDLPFINQEFLQRLSNEINTVDVLIIPSISSDDSFGTAVLYLKHQSLLSFQFGSNSSRQFRAEADQKNLKYRILHLDPYARDLDTFVDIQYLRQHLSLVSDPNPFIEILRNLELTTSL
ncbi:MAG: hypothetical protein JSV04_02780 [Candidatus Heimdallarchaeota archaeon]|nr:MAG: hypothetical protein JSV04_02780 [Candidatus Heimdallarchaeota archaeon]